MSLLNLLQIPLLNTPDATAVVFGNKTLTYQELDTQSNQLAHYLVSKGVREEIMVPICMERSLEMIIGILGVLKAGGAYVPLDPQYPISRINLMLAEIGATLFLTHQSIGSKTLAISESIEVLEWENISVIKDTLQPTPPDVRPSPNHLAYVIFTSGSAGVPKGVLIEHAQLLSSTLARNSFYQGLFNVLLIPSFAFDASVGAIFGSLASGGCLFLCSKEDLQDTAKLEELLSHIDTILCVPSYYSFLLEEGLIKNSKLSKVILGGENLGQELVSTHFRLSDNINLYNEYGPTETTVWATVDKVQPNRFPIAIGYPIATASTFILDPNGKKAKENQVGELHIGGEGLARGYLNDPVMTREKFIDNPLDERSTKLYKTGDLCYQLPDGKLVYVGRMDEQVKINGQRVELGEIESAILHNQNVKQAAAIDKKSAQGGDYLVAFIHSNRKLDQNYLRGYLRSLLPAYMIPQVWVFLDKFPLTPNGKIDKQKLRQLSIESYQTTVQEDPRDTTEEILLMSWQKLLQTRNISIHHNFFELGGNSLAAMRLAVMIKKQLKIAINVKDVFRHPTVAELGRYLNSKSGQEDDDSIKAVSPRLYPTPLSFGQESLWFIDQLEGSIPYHLPLIIKIEGELDIEALKKSLQQLLDRHEVLRAVVRENEGSICNELLLSENWDMDQIDAEKHPNEEGLQDEVNRLIDLPFDLSRDFMLRATLIRRGKSESVLLLNVHHIAFDAWSRAVLVKDLSSLYNAYQLPGSRGLDPLPIQYVDYAIWQKAQAKRNSFVEKINYWNHKLDSLVSLQLSKDFNAARSTAKGAVRQFAIKAELAQQLKSFSFENNATLFMTLLTGFKAMLHRYSSQEDICIGTAIADREEPETENLIGYFINSLVLRTTVRGEMSFLDLLDSVKDTTLEAYEHKEVPFERVVAEIGVERIAVQNPLFQVMFNLQNVPQTPLNEIEGLQLSLLTAPQSHSKFDLTFSLIENANEIQGTIEYRTDLYQPATIDRMISHYLIILQTGMADPSKEVGKLDLLSPEERQLLSVTFNATTKDYAKDKTIIDLLEEQAYKTPQHIALKHNNHQISYEELDKKSNQLAHLLISYGVKEESLVLLCIERSLEMMIGILGILKAGAAYVPVDPEYPAERIKFIQEDTAARLVLSSKKSQSKISQTDNTPIILLGEGGINLNTLSPQKVENSLRPHHLAYVIYTSGSTGKPKGVMIEHGNVVEFISWCKEEFRSSNFDLVYAGTSICFDLSVFELFFPLSIGKPIRLLENGLEIGQYLKNDSAVMVNTVPSMVGHLLDQNVDLSKVTVLNMAGEPIPMKILEGLDVEDTEVRNLYGPSEDTTYSTVYRIDKERQILIGKPINNTDIYIVSRQNELMPIGIPGEICIAGSGLARGYYNRKDLTQEKFVRNPFVKDPSSRLYKTGDIGRWTSGGQIEYLGRQDDQVKIRGYRIELGEIERTLQLYQGIKQAVVVVDDPSKENKQLVGYLTYEGEFNKQSVMSFLRKHLPNYMIPSLLIRIDTMPLTPNGKADKKALPKASALAIQDSIAPRNQIEADLIAIWKELLDVDQVGIHDNFFRLGGHSLLATSFIAAVRKTFEVNLRIQDFFTFPTIAGLTAQFDFESKSSSLPNIKPTLPRPETIPLSYNQETLWFIDMLSGSVQYHLPIVLKLNGNLDENALDQAIRKIIERHEVLRTVLLSDDGVPRQFIREISPRALSVIENEKLKDDPEGLKSFISDTIYQPFDLSKDYMLRVTLLRLDQQNHLLILVVHHIASDGWSTSLLINELTELYQSYRKNKEVGLAPLPLQYADFSIWQKKHFQGEFMENKLSYWKEKLAHLPSLQIPLDYPRLDVQSIEGAVKTSYVDQHLKERLISLGQQQGTTLFMTLFSAFKVLLYQYSGQQDICVGTVSAGRQQKDLEKLIGYFINTLPVRSRIDENASFYAVLEEVKVNCLEAYEHQEAPFDKIVAASHLKRDLSKNPLFQVMFTLKNHPEAKDVELEGLSISEEFIEQTTSKFDLSLFVSEKDAGLQLSMEFCTKLFKEETIKKMLKDYASLLASVVAKPEISIVDLNSPTAEIVQETFHGAESKKRGVELSREPDVSETGSVTESSTEKMFQKTWRKIWK